ncbi:MAG TPA: hypothetical protein VGJ21_18905 [Terracidiphilus sp.]|jgi:hypothetical protein
MNPHFRIGGDPSGMCISILAMTLRAFYRVVAVGTASLFGLMFAVDVLCVVFRWDSVTLIETSPGLVWMPFALLGGFLGIGTILLWFGMMWDCAITSKMPIWSKVLWMILLVPLSSLGALIYYFCIYRRSRDLLARSNQIPA